MSSKGNQRVKRKNIFSDTKIEPNMKALKKEDIIAQFDALKAKFDILEKKSIVLEKKNISLEKDNMTHIEAIHLLEETVKILETRANQSNVDKISKEIQTDTLKIEDANKSIYLCSDCDYIADCVHDFNDHTHSPEAEDEVEVNSYFDCKFCDESFETLPEVMKHKKAIHSSSVQHCKQFLENICYFGNNCWFLHSESLRSSEPSYTCNFCEEKFRTENYLREHMKLFHIQYVQRCKNENECRFGQSKCWFAHQKNIKNAYQKAKGDVSINDNDLNYDME